jgi:hypothetical protein
MIPSMCRWLAARPGSLALAIALTLCVGVSAADLLDRIVAIVAGGVILQSDVTAARALGLIPLPGDEGARGDEIRQVVDRVLVLEEVERFGGVEPDAARVDERLEAITTRLGTEIDVRLGQSGLDRAMLRRLAREQVRIETYLDQRFTGAAQPTDEEVDAAVREQSGASGGDDAHALARARLIDARRQQLIRDWIASLRRRADITMVGER